MLEVCKTSQSEEQVELITRHMREKLGNILNGTYEDR